MHRDRCKGLHCVDLCESFPTNLYLQNLASIQKRTSPVKFAHLAEKSGKVRYRTFQLRFFAVLDEATAAMDVDSESIVYERCSARGISMLSVAHRPTVIRHHTKVHSA